MNINQVPELVTHQEALNALGFSGKQSLEQVLGAAQVASLELAAYLGISAPNLTDTLNAAAPIAMAIPGTALATINQAIYSLGVDIDQVPQPMTAPGVTIPAASSPATVNWVAQMPPVRNQESRSTCVAHTLLAIYEHYLNGQGAYQDISEQFLYWNCKRNDGIPNQEGTWLAVAAPLLKRDGCCLEPTWPYNSQPIAGNEGQGPPPAGAQLEALTFRIPDYKRLSPTSVDDIKNELVRGRCVAFSIPVFNSWWGSKWVAYSGDITMPLPNEVRVGGHAMCIVGYQDMGNSGLGGGTFSPPK